MKINICIFIFTTIFLNLSAQSEFRKSNLLIKDGIIHFKDEAAFLSTYKQLLNDYSNEGKLNEWEKKNNFYSFRSYVNSIYNEYGDDLKLMTQFAKNNSSIFYFDEIDSIYIESIPDQVIATLANQNGIISVKDKYYRFFNNYIISIPSNDLSLLQKYHNLNGKSRLESKVDFQVEKYFETKEINVGNSRGNGNCTSFNEVSASNSQNNRKIKLQLYLFTSWNYTTVVCGSISYKNGFKYKTDHTVKINSISIQKPSGVWTKSNTTSSCNNVKECTPISTGLGSGHYTNYKIISANIRATHRGMDGIYASFVCQ